jgi:hypothetical protein
MINDYDNIYDKWYMMMVMIMTITTFIMIMIKIFNAYNYI